MYQSLLKEFSSKGIPIEEPNFYDHPLFLAEEQKDPSYLIKFSQYIATKPYSEKYLNQARGIVTKTVRVLSSQFIKNGREGACVDIAGILARMLERNGVWCVCIKGSCTIDFPSISNEERTYFWTTDHGEFTAAHAWVVAPPFTVVDITLKQQAYSGNKKQYIPEIVLSEKNTKAMSTIEDIISPAVCDQLRDAGISKSHYLEIGAPEMKKIQEHLPALSITSRETTIKYSPVAIHATFEALPDMNNMTFGGKSPYQLYVDEIRDVVGNISL